MADLAGATAAAMPGMPTGAPPAGMPVGGSGSGVVGSLRSVVALLQQISVLSSKIRSNAAGIRNASQTSSGTGNTGNGGSMGLGLAGFSNPPSALTPGGMRREAAAGFAFAGAQGLMAMGAVGYGIMPETSDVMARNRLSFNASLGASMSATAAGRMAASMNNGRMMGVTDPYLTAATLSMRGFGLGSAYGREAFNTAANLGVLTGQSAPSVAGTLASGLMAPQMGTRLQMLGIHNIDLKTGKPAGYQKMMDQLFNRLQFNKFTNVEDFNAELQRMGGANLAYYVPDPEMRDLTISYFQSKFKGGVNLNSKESKAIEAMSGGTLDMESAIRKYQGSESQKIEDFGESVSKGAKAAADFARGLNEALDPKNGLLQTLALTRGYLETFAGTKAGQAGLAGATLALQALTTAAYAAATMMGARALGGAGGAAGAGAAGAARGMGGAAKAARVGGGALGGILGLSLGSQAVDWLDDKNFSWAPDGGVVDKAGRFLGYAGAGAAGGAVMGGPAAPVTAVVGTVLGVGYGVYDLVTNPEGKSASEGSSAVSVVNGGAGAPGVSGMTTGPTGMNAATLASRYVGSPYVAGGRGPKGWDCAGFVYWVFKKLGKNLPQVSWEQVKQGSPVGSLAEAKPGDLLFFHMPNGHRHDPGPMKINHVGIYAGKGKMVHASTPTSGTIKSNVYTNNLRAIRRVLDTSKLSEGASKVLNDALQMMGGKEGNNVGTSYSVSTSGVNFRSAAISDSVSSRSIVEMLNSGVSGQVAPDTGDAESATTPGKMNMSDLPSGSGGKWLAQFLYNKGLRGDTLQRIWAIGMRESSGRPGVDNRGLNRNGSVDYGLFQINSVHEPWLKKTFGWNMEDMRDPNKAFRAMWRMSQHGQNLSAWNIGSGAYDPANSARHTGAWENWMGQFSGYANKAGLPGYDKGAWRINRDHVAWVHKDEMIFPASVAKAVRDKVQNGMHSGESVVINVYLNGSKDSDAMRFARQVKSYLNGQSSVHSIVGT